MEGQYYCGKLFSVSLKKYKLNFYDFIVLNLVHSVVMKFFIYISFGIFVSVIL